MSKLFREHYEKQVDLSWEHFQHGTYEKNCPDCFKENRIINAHKIVNSNEQTN